MPTSVQRPAATLLSVLACTLALGACNRSDNRTVGQKVDSAIATTEHKASEAAADVREAGRDAKQAITEAGRDAKQATSEAGRDAKQATAEAGRDLRQAAGEATRDARQAAGQAADVVGNKSKDLAITAEVNAKLVKDPALSALAINVDTNNGRVVLRGNAPDTAARSRATDLARVVDGVVAVSNELNVQPK